jgi:hypothetical protein
MSEPDTPGRQKKPVAVWPAVRQDAGHALQCPINFGLPSTIEDPGYAAHFLIAKTSSWQCLEAADPLRLSAILRQLGSSNS